VTGPGPLQVHGALARGVFAVTVLVSLAVLFAPGADVPSAPPGVDKLVHGSLFAALALTGRWAGMTRGVLAGVLVLYAAASELLQGIPVLQRDPSVGDWVADVVGILVGLLLWDLVSRRRAAR
jgi:membrane associated rhomboid family serine protease